MTLEECIIRFEDLSERVRPDNIPDGACIQFKIIGRDSGKFYLNVRNNTLEMVKGECKERNVVCIFTLAALEKVLDGVLDPIYAYTTGKFNMLGDIAIGRNLLNDIVSNKQNN